MGSFNNYVSHKDEGVLGQAWGAAKGAYQGWRKAGFEDYGKNAFQQGTMTPEQLELRRVNYAMGDVYEAINQITNPEIKQKVMQYWMPFYKNVTPMFHQYNQSGG